MCEKIKSILTFQFSSPDDVVDATDVDVGGDDVGYVVACSLH